MLTLDSAEGQRQKLVLFLLSVPFCLDTRGKMVIQIGYKRGTTFSLWDLILIWLIASPRAPSSSLVFFLL